MTGSPARSGRRRPSFTPVRSRTRSSTPPLTAEELGIDCDLERLPAFTYAEQDSEADKLYAEAEAAAKAGLDASFTREPGLPFPIAGAVRVEQQAQFHPRRYLLGLADAFTSAGGTIYEHTRVVDLDEGEPCRLTTETGVVITANEVVVATHYPIFDRALLFTRLVPHREVVLAAPIPADLDPQGMYLTREQNTRSVRTAPYRDGQRLLIVTGEHFDPGTGDVDRAVRAARRLDLRSLRRARSGVPLGRAGQRLQRWAALRRPPARQGEAHLGRDGLRRLGHEQRHHGRKADRLLHRGAGPALGRDLRPAPAASAARSRRRC